MLNESTNYETAHSLGKKGGYGGLWLTRNVGICLLLLGALIWAFGIGVYAHVEMMLENGDRVASGRLMGQIAMAWISPPLGSTGVWFPLSAASVRKVDIAMRQRRMNEGPHPDWGGRVELVKLKVVFHGGKRVILPVYFGRSHLYLMAYKTGGMDERVRAFSDGYAVEVEPLSAKQMAFVRKVSHLGD